MFDRVRLRYVLDFCIKCGVDDLRSRSRVRLDPHSTPGVAGWLAEPHLVLDIAVVSVYLL